MTLGSVLAAPVWAADAPAAKAFTAADLPATLPGYKLVELDVKKAAIVKTGSTLAEVELPVFVYFPIEFQARKASLLDLHNLYDQLVELAGKPSASAADFERALVVLDSAMSKLETNPAPHLAETAGSGPAAAK